MAADNAITVGNGSGGTLALMEKAFNSITKKFQRVTTVAGDTLAVSVISQTSTAAVAIPANASRVYAQVTVRSGGPIYLGATTGGLASAATRRTVEAGETWETAYYSGDIAIAAVSTTAVVELEQVT